MDIESMMAITPNVNLEDVLHDCRPLFVVYKDGQVHRFVGMDQVPPSIDNITGVESKDVVIDPETGVYVRLYKPQNVERVGLLVYYHGGGFCVETTSSPMFHNYLNNLSFRANIIIVSVDYRLAPEHPLPIGYEDSWAGLKWVFKSGQDEPWLRDHVDFSRVFVAGDSAGANIGHHMAKRVGKHDDVIFDNFTFKGMILVHPYFWGAERIGSEEKKVAPIGWGSLPEKLWKVASSSGLDDPRLNPRMDHEVGTLGADKVMVCVAEMDIMRDRGLDYKDVLLKSGWKGDVSVKESLGENHVFHLFKMGSPTVDELMEDIVNFFNH